MTTTLDESSLKRVETEAYVCIKVGGKNGNQVWRVQLQDTIAYLYDGMRKNSVVPGIWIGMLRFDTLTEAVEFMNDVTSNYKTLQINHAYMCREQARLTDTAYKLYGEQNPGQQNSGFNYKD